jgi:uncharacterized membrane protein
MSVEDALKMIVSLGVVVPPWHDVHPGREDETLELPVPPEAAAESDPASTESGAERPLARSKAAP